MVSSRLILSAALLGTLASAGAGWADPPCLDDIQKFCPNSRPDQSVQDCLKSHEADLTADCKGHVDGLRKTLRQLANICIWDIERFCGDVTPGGGRMGACLKQNEDNLSPICKAQFDKNSD